MFIEYVAKQQKSAHAFQLPPETLTKRDHILGHKTHLSRHYLVPKALASFRSPPLSHCLPHSVARSLEANWCGPLEINKPFL